MLVQLALLVSHLLVLPSSHRLLRFDGSLRAPSDPGFDTSMLNRQAACSACIFEGDTRVALGGKQLGDSRWQTSGEAEYEGLIFGLDQLCDLHRQKPHHNVIIQGDCKTVMEQLQGRARPRKMQTHYERAMGLVRRLLEHGVTLEAIRHIPREANWLCDAVAAGIAMEQHESAVSAAWQDLEQVRHRTINPAKEQTLLKLWDRHAGSLPLSTRPAFYQAMAQVASALEDHGSLLWVGEQMEQHVRTTPSGPNKDVLLVQAILYQINSLDRLGRTNEAAFRRRRHRHLLQRYIVTLTEGKQAPHVLPVPLGPRQTVTVAPENLVAVGVDQDWAMHVDAWRAAAVASETWRDTRQFWFYPAQS